jgi:hypothetical protein
VPRLVDPSPIALCTIEDVKAFLDLDPEPDEGDTPSPEQDKVDDLLQRMVNAAATTIHRVSGREFVSTAPGAGTERRFDIEIEHARNFRQPLGLSTRDIKIGDFHEAPSKVELRDPTTDYLYQDATAYCTPLFLGGRRNAQFPWEPFVRLRLGYYTLYTDPGTVLCVTTKWGFSTVPDDIYQSAYITAAEWYARDVEKFSGTFAASTDVTILARQLPGQVYDTVIGYRIVGV